MTECVRVCVCVCVCMCVRGIFKTENYIETPRRLMHNLTWVQYVLEA